MDSVRIMTLQKGRIVLLEQVYETMIGVLKKDACIPGVTDAFSIGMPCTELYEEAMRAYARITKRLQVENEDEDLEVIVNSFLEMQKILCYQMFIYGVTMSLDQRT